VAKHAIFYLEKNANFNLYLFLASIWLYPYGFAPLKHLAGVGWQGVLFLRNIARLVSALGLTPVHLRNASTMHPWIAFCCGLKEILQDFEMVPGEAQVQENR
jgi:hypothetical protein